MACRSTPARGTSRATRRHRTACTTSLAASRTAHPLEPGEGARHVPAPELARRLSHRDGVVRPCGLDAAGSSGSPSRARDQRCPVVHDGAGRDSTDHASPPPAREAPADVTTPSRGARSASSRRPVIACGFRAGGNMNALVPEGRHSVRGRCAGRRAPTPARSWVAPLTGRFVNTRAVDGASHRCSRNSLDAARN